MWAIWPKKVDTLEGQHAVRCAIARDGFETVLAGTERIVAADSRRKVSPPGRYLPRPAEFFDAGRYLDDPEQYGPREAAVNVDGLRRHVADLEAQIKEHPGNPANTEGSLERKKEAREEFGKLRAALQEARQQLTQAKGEDE